MDKYDTKQHLRTYIIPANTQIIDYSKTFIDLQPACQY
jgi:hypothetical protein